MTGISYLEPLQLSRYSDGAMNYTTLELGFDSLQVQRFVTSQHQNRIYYQPKFLCRGYREGFFPEGKSLGTKLITHLYLVTGLRMRAAIPSFPHTSSRCCD